MSEQLKTIYLESCLEELKVNKPGMGRYTITHFFNIRP